MRTGRYFLVLGVVGLAAGCFGPQTRLQMDDEKEQKPLVETIGDVTEAVINAEPTPVMGVGLVVDLNGTGGGMPPQSSYRSALENELKRAGVEDVKKVLSSPNHTMVIVTAIIPPGTRKGDPIDLDVSLPPGSRCSSLRGGRLLACELRNFDSTKNLHPGSQGPERWLAGHVQVKVDGGTILVGMNPAKPDTVRGVAPEIDPGTSSGGDYVGNRTDERSGRVWGGGRSVVEPPLYLSMKSDKQFARIAARVADRINETFPGSKFGRGATANAQNKMMIALSVPSPYRHNLPRYLRVVRLIPMEGMPAPDGPYRRQLAEQLIDPSTCITAALRLEALGNDSAPVLKTAIKAPSPLVRFAASEALAYLGHPACGEELSALAQEHVALRAFCLAALASLDEAVCHIKLTELMSTHDPELRYGAFRALRVLDDRDPAVRGERPADAFWIHRVAGQSKPMVHYLTTRRSEIVLFGDNQMLVPPFSLVAGEFTLVASNDGGTCTIGRFDPRRREPRREQCSLMVVDVLKTVAKMGGTYADAVAVLKKIEDNGCLNCDIVADALPRLADVSKLAELGKSDPALRTQLSVAPTLFGDNP
jgi:hypothetical protein